MANGNQYGLLLEDVGGDPSQQYMDSLQNLFGQAGQDTLGSGQTLLGKGLSSFAPAQNYFNDILSGDKASMDAATAPEKSDILSQYRARRRNQAKTASRSGGTNEATANSEYSEAGDVSKLIQSLRPKAAAGSMDIASQLSQLGLSESDLGNKELLGGLSSLMQRKQINAGSDTSTLGFISSLVSAII